MLLERTVELATILVLAVTLPVAVIAVRGFRGTPFGSVLRPLPVVLVAYIAMNVPSVMGAEAPETYYLLTSTMGVVGALVSAAHALVLLTERRKL
jgi:uncharacterized membrane protein